MLHIVELVVWNELRKVLFDEETSTKHITFRTQFVPFIIFMGFGGLLVLLFGLRKFLDKCLGCGCESDND